MAYYLVLGEVPVKRTLDFVEFDFSELIIAIRHAIYNKKKNTFTNEGIDENNLILWKVDIPFDNENDKLKKLNDTPYTINIEQDLDGKEMFPGEKISKHLNHFNKPPSSIHIIVQTSLPAITGNQFFIS
jgi:hypothetical protein